MFNNQDIIDLAKRAGAAIIAIYQQDFAVYEKQDESPLTEADLASHHCIVNGLKQLTPQIPVLSEESGADEHLDRMSWQRYWLIDPLDGTKEFIKKNDEFTVNIALIDQGKAVFGVVYAPALDVTYWGDADGAFKESGGKVESIRVSEIPAEGAVWRVVGSRSHQTDEFKAFVKGLPDTEVVSMGSSLKLCLVAEGVADLYPRLGLTSEWDTAAAHAVVTAAGGQVLQYPELTPLLYNARPDTLLNPFFIVCADKSDKWV
ncbi:MAG: 3'(2'),5'-bisphosphate nucleotidase CysQ [Oceanospirillales bacterium]|nr:3'(2'),5'-bisphosphate nucleotidase CysQ [Oceanospirillales bacterium]